MSQPYFDPPNETKFKIARHSNDVIMKSIQNNDFIYVVKHNPTDPTRFTIISDPYFDDVDEDNNPIQGKMVGTELTFADPTAFKTLFPQLAQLPPVHLPPNTIQNQETGKPEGIPADEIQFTEIKTYPPNTKTKNSSLSIQVPDDSDIGAVWIAWKFSDITRKSGYNFSIGVSDNGKNFNILSHLKNMQVMPDNNDSTMAVYGLSTTPQQTIRTKYILIQINNINPDFQIVNPLDAIATFRLTRSTAVM